MKFLCKQVLFSEYELQHQVQGLEGQQHCEEMLTWT